MPRIDLITQRFGFLTVIQISTVRGTDGSYLWKCLCVCGKTCLVAGPRLRRGDKKSCGCMRHKYRHGLAGTRIQHTWYDMMGRCYNPKYKNYHNYGGRGIFVCERWHNIKLFHQDMGDPPEGLSLERMDNNGPYCPENCKWDTMKNQLRNQRRNHLVTAFGETKTMAEWSELTGFVWNTIKARLLKGMLPEDTLTQTTRRGIVSKLNKPMGPSDDKF